MKIVFLLFSALFFCCPLSSAQSFYRVDTLRHVSGTGTINLFPLFRSEKNKSAAQYINEYLHADFLHVLPGRKNPFAAISPDSGTIQGTSDVSFTIRENSDRVTSVTLSAMYTAAYSEYFDIHYNFNAKTGEYIQLADLFDETALKRIKDTLTALRVAQITQYLEKSDTLDETYAERYNLYSECLPYLTQSNLVYEGFLAGTTTMTFIHPRCSVHANRYFDDLDEFYTSLPMTFLKPLLTPFGNAWLYGNAQTAFTRPAYPAMKLMKGTIGKNMKVTMLPGRKYTDGDDVYGMYFYDRYGSMIEIGGTVSGDQWTLQEHGPSGPVATITGTWKNRVFTGTWKRNTDGKSLPVKLVPALAGNK